MSHHSWTQELKRFETQPLNIDMTRGKPCPEQLDLSVELLTCLSQLPNTGQDYRNYGLIAGIPEARRLFGDCYQLGFEEIIVANGSSLTLMHDTVVHGLLCGLATSSKPWTQVEGGIQFLCPSPGYDRHFDICEKFGIGMIPIKMTGEGPDMEVVEKLVFENESIKGIWCVPKYSNPTGETYSDSVIKALAGMKTKAKDFYILWDNAYAVHFLDPKKGVDSQPCILKACQAKGYADRVLIYGSTSKITFPGSGLSVLGGSQKNIEYFKTQMSKQSIGPNKVNQARHVAFFKNMDGILSHMKKHAQIIGPKFELVSHILKQYFPKGAGCSWTRPGGGYFMDVITDPGYAKKVVAHCAELGVLLTQAGKTFPYGQDPKDQHIRLAPTYPTMEELDKATRVLALSIQAQRGR